jgi:predicted transcriptional regulator
MATQVNVRLDDHLLNEIDIITKVLHITRTEWLRTKIARAVKDDTLDLMEAIVLEYARGHISDDELNEILGTDAEEIRLVVHHVKKGRKDVEKMVTKGIL